MRGLAMTVGAVRAVLATDPDVAERLLRIMARRIRWTTGTITDTVYADVAARAAKQLLGLAQRFGVQEGGAVRVPMHLTQVQFAHLVGMSRESVNKALCEFNQRGWIRTQRDNILINDSAPLVTRTLGCRWPGRLAG